VRFFGSVFSALCSTLWQNQLMDIRVRTPEDVAACVTLATKVREVDNYPKYLPADFESFLVRPDAINAWIAEEDGVVVGHVSLHESTTPEAMECASNFAGVNVECLAAVSRLLVTPESRGLGIGRSLLETSTQHAKQLGLTPMLDVVTGSAHAIELYERCGWIRAGEVRSVFRNGAMLDEFVYLCP
jgi:GNAT superfamily N-acetyltransferase